VFTRGSQHYLTYCFNVLLSYLKNEKSIEKFPQLPDSYRNKQFPLFVTWTKDDRLRGCIGTFQSEDLDSNLSKYTLISALKDTRFKPITLQEVPSLNCGVSLLINFDPCEHPLDWEVGKHGIIIEFTFEDTPYRGTYLPEVAKEQKWDQKTSLTHLIKKAGYYGKVEDILDKIKTTRYQSIKANMHYNDNSHLENEDIINKENEK